MNNPDIKAKKAKKVDQILKGIWQVKNLENLWMDRTDTLPVHTKSGLNPTLQASRLRPLLDPITNLQ